MAANNNNDDDDNGYNYERLSLLIKIIKKIDK